MTFCVRLIRANKYWLSVDGGLWAGCCLWFRESSAAGTKGVLLLSICSLPMRKNPSLWPQLTPPDMLINTEYLSYTLLLCLIQTQKTHTNTPLPLTCPNNIQTHMCAQSHPRTSSLSHTHIVKEKHICSLSLTQTHTWIHTRIHTKDDVSVLKLSRTAAKDGY